MIECIPRRCRSKHQLRDCNTQDYPIPHGYGPHGPIHLAGGDPIETYNHGSFCNYFWKEHEDYVVDQQSYFHWGLQSSADEKFSFSGTLNTGLFRRNHHAV